MDNSEHKVLFDYIHFFKFLLFIAFIIVLQIVIQFDLLYIVVFVLILYPLNEPYNSEI